MDITGFSSRYAVRRLVEEDIPMVYELCQGNTAFYRYCPPCPSPDSIRADMQALPPHKSMKDKCCLGFFEGASLLAVLDLIVGFPDAKTAFIGIFMLDAGRQRQGIGAFIIKELCGELRGLGYEKAKLGWARDNRPAESFWRKHGFVPTGVVDERTNPWPVIIARKILSD